MASHCSEYQTLAGESKAVIREKMSRFIAFARPVGSAAEAKEWIGGVANEYHDARHVCWAYMLGADRTDFRANDNGEPSGTAGKPILGQINSLELTNVLVAVVRYFGGIKLGTSGLIVAYRQAARDALDSATIVELHETELITFSYPYMAMNEVMKLTRGEGVEMVSSIFDNTCTMTLRVERDRADSYRRRLADIDGVTLKQDQTD